MFLFVVLGLVLTANAAPKIHRPHHFEDRIVGGRPTTIEEYPYQVSVHSYDYFECGGSIISPRYVITAGHCTHSIPDNALSVRAASNTTEENGQYIPVKKVHRNGNFSIVSVDYDISILELYTSIKFGPAAMPIAITPSDFYITAGKNVTVTGWGSLDEDGELPDNLQVVEIPTISNEECKEAYAFKESVTDRMLCARTKNGGKDACQGDSGGPLVANGLLVGIVSWGFGCGRAEYPGVYTRVSELRDFIKNVTNL